MLMKGSPSPVWTGSDQNDTPHASQEYAGKWLLLYFYPEDDTPGCTTEACGFRDHYEKLSQRIAIVGVSADSTASHKKFAEKYQLPFTLIADPDRLMHTAFGVGTDFKKRVTFLINPSGIIEKIYSPVSEDTHAETILSDLLAKGV